jgi:hypothetical protein
MEVHLNFSPIIYHKGWLQEYEKLFKQVHNLGVEFKSECIFLTYNDKQVERNSDEVNKLCYKPHIQELKNSYYSDENIRYKSDVKKNLVRQFKELYGTYFPLESIRYIF